MLQNALHVAQTTTLSGPTQKVTKVRISISPPFSLGCRETPRHSRQNYEKLPQFCDSLPETGPEKNSCSAPQAGYRAFFSGVRSRSPVSTSSSGESTAIINRRFGERDLTLAPLPSGITSKGNRNRRESTSDI